MRKRFSFALLAVFFGVSVAGTDSEAVTLSALEEEMVAIRRELKNLPVREPWEADGTAGVYFPRVGGGESTATVDLGQAFPIDCLALIPTRLKSSDGSMEVVGFSENFELLGALDEQFESVVRFEVSDEAREIGAKGYPVLVDAGEKRVRFVRVLIKDAPRVRDRAAASFAELFVFSGGRNVALGKSVVASGARAWKGFFKTSFLVDGQTSFGQPILLPEKRRLLRGWHAKVQNSAPSDAFVELAFEEAVAIDEIRLYPVYHSLWPRNLDYGFPLRFVMEARSPDGRWQTLADWSKRDFPSPRNSPAYFSFGKVVVDEVRLRALELPESIPGRFVFAMAEIEVYADGLNVAPRSILNSSAMHERRPREWNLEALVDGYSSRGQILPLVDWLEALARRGELENRLLVLEDLQLVRKEGVTRMLRITVGVLSMLLLLSGGLLLAVRHRRQTQLKELQNRIASDLHDEVGSNLASMTILAASAQEECRIESHQSATLKRLVEIAKETSSSMHDIVWLLHPDRKANMSLGAKLKEIASSLLADTDISYGVFEYASAEGLSMDHLHHFILFYKETLHNLARHGRPERVEMSLAVEKKTVRLSIKDDGVSLESGDLPEGLRLRAKKFDARWSYEIGSEWNTLSLEF